MITGWINIGSERWRPCNVCQKLCRGSRCSNCRGKGKKKLCRIYNYRRKCQQRKQQEAMQ
ncbi:MAG: hypothetical protein [Siphoviridae sp. ctjeG17]|nr:MAG: hypothetical protein [Siphoviridae sp. ctjeG17]